MSSPLESTLLAVLRQNGLRSHVPGHAGRWLGSPSPLLADSWFYADVTELEGLDVLSEPDGCLAEAQHSYAHACGVAQTFFLTNGSTTGLTAAMLAMGLQPCDTVLVARNAHRSIISGLILTGAKPLWVQPKWQSEWGLWQGLNVCDLPPTPPDDAKALVVTSPTYEGVGSPIEDLAAYCQQHNLYLLVDEAHGALWPFHPALPPSACQVPGVDAVVQSCHKTLGSLTQTAVLHLPHQSCLAVERVQQSVNIMQTSSPSYPLMLSMDAIRAHWQTHPQQLDEWLHRVHQVRQQLADLPGWLLRPCARLDDPSRLILKWQHQSERHDWAIYLEHMYGIPYEAVTENAAVYVWGVGLQPADASRFVQALVNMNAQPEKALTNSLDVNRGWNHAWPIDQVLTPRQAFFSAGESVDRPHAEGRIAQQTVVHCPPGVPVLIHGERIQAHHVPYLPDCVQVVA